jgi:hypothetical protein
MADLTASDVTVTKVNRGGIIPGFARLGLVDLSFGNGAKTVPSEGIPLPADLRLYGMHKSIKHMTLQGPPASGLVFEYDQTNHKLLIRQSAGAAHSHDLKVIGLAAAGIDEPLGVEGGDTLAKDAATDRTIAGAASATKGGVMAATVAAAALAAYTGAIAATVVRALVLGD